MVRLKGKKSVRKRKKREISIPYGAIKSNANGKLAGTYMISIPYGAIKRVIIITDDSIVKCYFNSLWCD